MALAPLAESHLLLYEGWWGGKGKAYLFIAQTGRYIYTVDLALRAMFPSLHASTGRSRVENPFYRDQWSDSASYPIHNKPLFLTIVKS
jgi:hypothetical protein